MKTKNLFHIFLGSLFLLYGITGCQKDEVKSPEITIVEDDAIADEMFDAVFTEVEDATASMEEIISGGALKASTKETCKIITVDIPGDNIIWPKTITVDYGNGCVGANGRVRKGKIIIVVSDKVSGPSYSRTITFDHFSIDDYLIEGTKTIARAGKNDCGNPLFDITLVDGKITSPEGKIVTKEFNRIREWVNGYSTPRYRWDDEYMVTGTATGTDRNGEAYTKQVILPLHKKNNCPWVVSGSVKITKTGKPDAILDYGNDVCDRKATVTISGIIIIIILHR